MFAKLSIAKLPVNKTVAMQLIKIQKNSPALLFGAGVVGIVGTVVMASKATLQLNDILEDTSVTLNKINDLEHEDYSNEDRMKDKAIAYTQSSLKISRIYAPAFLLGVASIGALTGSHYILSSRNAALGVAFAGVQQSLIEYRGRVSDSIGVEKEAKLWQPVEMVDTIDAEGKKVKTAVPTEKGGSPYKVLFGEHNPNWNDLTEYNQIFLQAQQNFANDLLRARGVVFLNDVHEMLGLERTKAGQIVGWVLNGKGDNFIDFGFFTNTYQGMRFVTGAEKSIWLDFNVDGSVLDLLD